MTEFIRTFWLCLVLFTLPLQGMAQANMFACHMNSASTEAVQATHHPDMDHERMSHSEHRSSVGQGTPSDTLNAVHTAKHGCCNCAPSCAIVLLDTPITPIAVVHAEVVLNAVSVQQPYSADTRRIDRPPKMLAI